MATRGASDHHQKGMPLDRDRTVHSPDVSSDGSEVSWKNSTIAARSSRDRGAIEEIPAPDRRGFISNRSAGDRRSTSVTIDARSWRDRGKNRGGNRGLFETNLKPNPSGFFCRIEATTPHPRNRSHDVLKRRPQPLQLATIFGPISLLKACISLL